MTGDELRRWSPSASARSASTARSRPTLLAHFLGRPGAARVPRAPVRARSSRSARSACCGRCCSARARARPARRGRRERALDRSRARRSSCASLAAALPGHRVLLVLSTRPGFERAVARAACRRRRSSSEASTAERRAGDGRARSCGAAPSPRSSVERARRQERGQSRCTSRRSSASSRRPSGIVVEDGEARLSSAGRRGARRRSTTSSPRASTVCRRSLKQTLQAAAVSDAVRRSRCSSRVLESDARARRRQPAATSTAWTSSSPARTTPSSTYSFKHALTQDVVYASLLERRRRRVPRRGRARRSRSSTPSRIDEVVELLAYHFGRSGEDEKAVDYAILAAEKAQRRWANTEALAALRGGAQAPRRDARHARPNRLRRIDAVVKQAEIKFALGRHAEHVQALEAIRDLVEAVADPPRRAAWFYWAGFLHSLTGAPPGGARSRTAARRSAIARRARASTSMRAFAECCLAHVLPRRPATSGRR